MREQLQHLAISPSGFVFDPMTGATFTANRSAMALLEGIREGRNLESLVKGLEETFEQRGADLRRDILEFVRTLQDEGLLPREFELE